MITVGVDGNLRLCELAKRVAGLILNGVSTDKILILTLNSFKKEQIIEKVNEIIFENSSIGFGQLNIFTFSGLAYNSILKNWVNVEKIISTQGGETEIYPTLSGLDASQYFLQKIIKEEDFEDYFSKKNLMHQLLRRYKLIVENSLCDKEVTEKSSLLTETFAKSAFNAITSYKVESSKNRIFDNLKQISSFMYLFKNNKIRDFDNVEYFFVDDADEYSYCAFEFCKIMMKKAKESYIYMDKDGCSRKGYLCGYSDTYNDLKQEFNFEEVNLLNHCENYNDAKTLYNNLVLNEKKPLKNFEHKTFSKRLEMIEGVTEKITELLNNGVKINDIQLIAPVIDESLIYALKVFFKKKNIKIQTLAGNKKITEDLYVYTMITILELLNDEWKIKPNGFDIRILLNEILQIPIYDCKNFVLNFEKNGILLPCGDNKYYQYDALLDVINDADLKKKNISEQFDEIFARIIAPNMLANSDFEPLNLLAKSIKEFEIIKDKFSKFNSIELTPTDWLLHIKNSIVSQNPSKPAHIDKNSLIISTAQKIIDFSLKSDYQFWLDVTSNEWIKEDTGTIYNAWVFQKNFRSNEFSTELNRRFTFEKTARMLRKLILCANKKILCYSSTFDSSGRENFGELTDFIELEEEQEEKFCFIPRDDQKEILNYNSGKMAVPAVPGAGKTTVMLALLVELVKKNIKPQEILVLTYMESAARNFLNRFKKITSSKRNLPQISTIHAFAYKILMENNNYALINLPEEFSICDDALKTSLIKEVSSYNLPAGENLDDWSALMISGISKAKLNRLSPEHLKISVGKDQLLNEFLVIYKAYQEKLKELALLDYDDLLMYAVKLLKDNENIAKYYQEKFKYIIEDEAQDSSGIQQEFISILSAKYGNVIRCGDVNQAILGTFSNADVEGFKNFIAGNKKVEMFRSQRSAKGIYEFANSIVEQAKNNQVTKNAFYDLKMQGVDGKNPFSKNPVKYDILENPADEKEMVLNDIKNKLQNFETQPSVAILLRTNRQVSDWAAFVEKQGLKVICRGDSYKQKKVFNFLLGAMELYADPWNNKVLAKFYKEFCNIEKFTFDKTLFDFIEKNENVVLSPEFIKVNSANKILEKFWWEAFYIVENRTLDIQEIIIYCANTYFEDIVDRSNAFLFSILIKRYTNTLVSDEKFKLNYIPEMIKYFKNFLSQKTLKGINLFAKEDDDSDMCGFVQVMTIHKSKGAEFDYVYLPEFTEYNYSLNFAKCCEKINKRKKPLLNKLDKIITGKEPLPSKSAIEEMSETLRLIYVAVTRAKLGLTFSYSQKNDFKKDNLPVEFIENLF